MTSGVVRPRRVWALAWSLLWVSAFGAFGGALSPEQRSAYSRFFDQELTAASAFLPELQAACKSRECVQLALGLSPIELRGQKGMPVRVSEYGLDELGAEKRPARVWSSVLSEEASWNALMAFLCDGGGVLESALDPASRTSESLVCELSFSFPRPRSLQAGQSKVQLSPLAQRYLKLAGRSTYAARRHVLIVEEPHFELEQQVNLFRGLEVFFRDNPGLLAGNRTVFLAEGYPAGQPLSVQPLIAAEPKPSDALIRRVLATFLIPGYVAYEWKHQRGIPIVGSEDPELYRISAFLWADIQGDAPRLRAALWSRSVAARNPSMVRTLLAQMETHECPILFVGGKHLEGVRGVEQISEAEWEKLERSDDAPEAPRLKKVDRRGIAKHLEEQKVGYCFLAARDAPFPDLKAIRRAKQQYLDLFDAQRKGDTASYVKGLVHPGGRVTVAPSPKAAADFVKSDKDRSKDGREKGDGKEPDGNGEGWKQKLRELLDVLRQKIAKAGRAIGARIRDITSHPENWERVGRKPDPQQPRGGRSDRELWRNRTTGETLERHVLERDGQPADGHPHYAEPEGW